MAEDIPEDPRDLPWHPRRQMDLYGHGGAESQLLRAHASSKLHHAWLISGSQGIGKATLAYRFARYLAQPVQELRAGSLEIPKDSQTSRLVSAGAHPNIFVLQRGFKQKAKGEPDKPRKLKTEIAVDDARDAIDFIHRTSASGGWRIVIVDPVDELNASSANSLLKVIEEPPQRSIFLLVCHQPGRLLRTIRSRSIHLALENLDIETTLRVLRELPPGAIDGQGEALRLAAQLSKGSPGRALELVGSKGAVAYAEFLKRARLSPGVAVEIGAMFTGRESPEDYYNFCELLVGWIGEKAREAGLQGRGGPLAAAHDDINASLRQTDALNLDRRQTVTDALMRIEEALKAS